MKTCLLFILTAGLILPLGASRDNPRESSIDTPTIAFENPSGPKKVVVDNIFGSIEVKGVKGNEVRAVIKKSIYATSDQDLAQAKDEVKLDISQKDNQITFYVDGPFREKNQDRCRQDFQVHYDFALEVPMDVELKLHTVTGGDIKVQRNGRDFDIHNVNGKINLAEMGGSGRAHTVNGNVDISFTAIPQDDCSFKTINGDIDLRFPGKPKADFHLKTFHGKMYSDFEVDYLPQDPVKGTRIDGKFVYRNNGFQKVRIGSGGIDIKMDTLNGNLYIANNQKHIRRKT